MQDFSALFPVEVITEMLGVPAELRQQVRLLLDKRSSGSTARSRCPRPASQAGIETGLMYYNIIQERRADPQDDMISDLIAVELERDGATTKLDDIEITGFASMLGGAGRDRDEVGRQRGGHVRRPSGSMADAGRRPQPDPAAVEELLRWEAPAQYLVRYTLKDVELHGTTIPAGQSRPAVPGFGQP